MKFCKDFMMDRKHISTTASSSQRFKSFFIKDILDFDDDDLSKNIGADSLPPSTKEERVQNWDVLEKKKKQSFGKEKNKCARETTISRSPFHDKQREILEKHFHESKYISLADRKNLAKEIHLTERQIKTWYQNRRTRWRKAHGNDGLSKGTLLAEDAMNSENVIAQNILSNFSDKLSLECVSLLHKQLTGNIIAD